MMDKVTAQRLQADIAASGIFEAVDPVDRPYWCDDRTCYYAVTARRGAETARFRDGHDWRNWRESRQVVCPQCGAVALYSVSRTIWCATCETESYLDGTILGDGRA